MLVGLSINPSKTSDRIVEFIKTTVHKAGFSRVVIGLSGGIDSAVSCALAVRALGRENIYVGLFPYGDLSQEGLDDARLIINRLRIPQDSIILIDIKPLTDPIITASFRQDLIKSHDRGKLLNNKGDLRKGNIMVRVRMILLYDLSKKLDSLVFGTENKTEYLLGYYTRFGDEASDIEPLRGLYKTQVRKLASFLRLPFQIIQKTPTAGMWSGQTDEGELGFTYEEADQILHLYKDRKKSREEISKMGFDGEVIDRIITRVKNNEFKHKLPYMLRD